jgi:thioredoxin-like negative regulator of GroEL
MVLRVFCLCALWCRTCGEYRVQFDALQRRWPDVKFEWIDIEDQADRVGDLDIENFPTVLLVRDGKPTFFGTVLPHIEVLERTLERAAEARFDNAVPAEVLAQLPHLIG